MNVKIMFRDRMMFPTASSRLTSGERLYREGIDNPSYVTGCSYDNALVPNSSERNMALIQRLEVYLYPNNDVRVNPCR